MAEERFHSFSDFWLHYLSEHRNRWNGLLHFLGTASAILSVACAYFLSLYLLLLFPLIVYGLAWTGHYLIERNRPATFTYPIWALLADFKMFGLMLVGKMNQELDSTKAQTSRCPAS